MYIVHLVEIATKATRLTADNIYNTYVSKKKLIKKTYLLKHLDSQKTNEQKAIYHFVTFNTDVNYLTSDLFHHIF